MRILVVGWFSLPSDATAGDRLAADVASGWLADAGIAHDVALAFPHPGGVDWRAVDPAAYTHVLFVCGPISKALTQVTEIIQRFPGCRSIALNVSLLDPPGDYPLFDLLLERDSTRATRPDLSMLAHGTAVPVVGVIRVPPQPEYADRMRHDVANEAIDRLATSRPMAAVAIDTRLGIYNPGLRSAAEVESLIARMDLVVTTRLHGMVLALKNGVPAIAVDPIARGAKVLAQARAIGWPIVFGAEDLTDGALQEAFEFCLGPDARALAAKCRDDACVILESVRSELLDALTS